MINLQKASPLVVLLLAAGAFSQTESDAADAKRSLQMKGSPLSFVSDSGSALVLKNVSNKRVTSYVLGCVAQRGNEYISLVTFDRAQVDVNAGALTSEGAFEGTPLKECSSRKGMLTVSEVAFSDKSVWKTPLKCAGTGNTSE